MEEKTASRKRPKRRSDEVFNQTFLESRAAALSLTNQIPFPVKLYQMLEDLEETGNDHIASWSNDGDCIRVHDTASFVDKVLPSYFRQSNYKSFQKQLYLYGFSRISDGRYRGYYFHPDFQRSDKSQCGEIIPKRRKGRSTKTRLPSASASDDDSNKPSGSSSLKDMIDTPSSEISATKHPAKSMEESLRRGSQSYTTTVPSALISNQHNMYFPPEGRLPLNLDLNTDTHRKRQESAFEHVPGTQISDLSLQANSNLATGTSIVPAPSQNQPAPFATSIMGQTVSGEHLLALHRQCQMNASLFEAFARHRDYQQIQSQIGIAQIQSQFGIGQPGVARSTMSQEMGNNNLSMIQQQSHHPGLIGPVSMAAMISNALHLTRWNDSTSHILPNQQVVASLPAKISAGLPMQMPLLSSMVSSSWMSRDLQETATPEHPTSSTATLQNEIPTARDSPLVCPPQVLHPLSSTSQAPTTEMPPGARNDRGDGTPPHTTSSSSNSIDSTIFDSPT